MGNITKLFDPVLVKDLMEKVKGKSALAHLSPQIPVPFTGSKEFVFTMDNEIDIVAENGKFTHGGIELEPVVVRPIKFEYGARVSDEFMKATEEEKINILKAFNDGFAKKVAKGLDIAAMHGVNPRTGAESEVVGSNCFDKKVDQTVTYDAGKIDENVEAAIEMVNGAENDVNGMAMSTQARSALAKLTYKDGAQKFPELAWGNTPSTINGLLTEVNNTVNNGTVKDRAILGDFAEAFKWGYGKEVSFEVIEYGDPDNSGKDLKGHGQVYLRAYTFLGWGIMDKSAFSRIVEA